MPRAVDGVWDNWLVWLALARWLTSLLDESV